MHPYLSKAPSRFPSYQRGSDISSRTNDLHMEFECLLGRKKIRKQSLGTHLYGLDPSESLVFGGVLSGVNTPRSMFLSIHRLTLQRRRFRKRLPCKKSCCEGAIAAIVASHFTDFTED